MKNKNDTIGYIYMITSPSNRIYIGSTVDIKLRWRKYKTYSCKGQTKLYNSLVKYNYENHNIEIIWSGDINDMLRYETIIGNWYEVLDKKKGLNLKLPKIDDVYQCISEETSKLMSKSQTGRIHSQETKNKISNAHKGKKRKKFTALAIKNISESHFKPVLQYDLNGNFIAEFISINHAREALNSKTKVIGEVCRGKRKSLLGFIWKYKK